MIPNPPSLTEQQCTFISNFAKLVTFINQSGYGVKVCELNRTVETQRQYVVEGKSKTMDSRHLDKLAVDLALFKDGQVITAGEAFRPFGVYWESLGGRWGGRFGLEKEPKEVQDVKLGWDSPHYEARKLA